MKVLFQLLSIRFCNDILDFMDRYIILTDSRTSLKVHAKRINIYNRLAGAKNKFTLSKKQWVTRNNVSFHHLPICCLPSDFSLLLAPSRGYLWTLVILLIYWPHGCMCVCARARVLFLALNSQVGLETYGQSCNYGRSWPYRFAYISGRDPTYRGNSIWLDYFAALEQCACSAVCEIVNCTTEALAQSLMWALQLQLRITRC